MKLRFRLAWLALLLVPLAAPATGAQDVAPAVVPSAVSFGGMFQMLMALLVVLAAIVGTGWLLRRFGPTQLGPGGAMKVLGGVAVGPRERLVLVEVGETWLIVGVAQGQVTAVHTMARPPGGAPQSLTANPGAPFAERLRQMLGPKQG
jgi:flagellar protein FliO/FliZ